MKNRLIEDKDDLKVDQILLVPMVVQGQITTLEKVVSSIDRFTNNIKFADGTWMGLDNLLQSKAILIGEMKSIKFLKFLRYRSFY